LERLRNQQKELSSQINLAQKDVAKLDGEIDALSKRRAALVATLENKQRTSNELEKTIVDAEATYNKLVESSQTLLAFMKKEAFEVERSLKSDS